MIATFQTTIDTAIVCAYIVGVVGAAWLLARVGQHLHDAYGFFSAVYGLPDRRSVGSTDLQLFDRCASPAPINRATPNRTGGSVADISTDPPATSKRKVN